MKKGITTSLIILNLSWLLIAMWQLLDFPKIITNETTNDLLIFININWFLMFCIIFMLFYIGFLFHALLNKSLPIKSRILWFIFILLFNGLAFTIYWFYYYNANTKSA